MGFNFFGATFMIFRAYDRFRTFTNATYFDGYKKKVIKKYEKLGGNPKQLDNFVKVSEYIEEREKDEKNT